MRSLIIFTISLISSLSFGCSQYEAEVIGTVRNPIKNGSGCEFNMVFSYFQPATQCGLERTEAMRLDITDRACKYKQGQLIRGTLVSNGRRGHIEN